MDKKMYRATLRFTEAKYAEVKPSNIFLRAVSLEKATEDSKATFINEMITAGISSKAPFSCEVREVSQSEVDEYQKNMKAGNVSRMVN